MQILTGLGEIGLPDEEKAAVAIGKFDGIHIGHQQLLQLIIEGKKKGLKAVVFTFDPSPEEFFTGLPLPVLDTKEEKRQKFLDMGIDYLIEFPLNHQTAAISPKDFMQDILYDRLHAGLVVSGTDISFGDKGKGNAEMLQEFAKEKQFTYQMIDKVYACGKEVSSSRIREAVANGLMEEAAAMLGESYGIYGKIVHGRHLGHTLEMPTVNIIPQENKLLPPRGVYATVSKTQEMCYYGITNIGYKPTVSNTKTLGVETYLYDYEGDLYGETIHTRLLHFMRPEQKFTNIEALKKQLFQDRENGKQYIPKFLL